LNHFINRDGLKIAWQSDCFAAPWSAPDTVLLLHAAMGSSARWFRWIAPLAARYRVMRMDLRGHGQSQTPDPAEPFSLAHLVGDVIELLDRLEVDAVHLVGNSAGGYVAQRLAIEHPARVRSMAIFGSTPGLKHSHAPTWVPKIKERGLATFLAETIQERFDEHADPELVRWFIQQAGSNDPAFIGRFVLHMCEHDFMDELVRITAPTLIVAAGRESIGHASAYPQMQANIRGSELTFIDTAAHNICDGYADQCVAMLLRFFDRIGARSGDLGRSRA
jgi:pimeloyl-ACP methyl ester carboxylesterase